MSPREKLARDARWRLSRSVEARRGWSRNYPDSPMVDEEFTLRTLASNAIMHFKADRPFRGTDEEYREKVRLLYAGLCAAYKIPRLSIGFQDGDSSNSYFSATRWHIQLHGRSVLTALHEFAHALGFGETGAVWWSNNVFRLYWPRSYERLHNIPGTHMMVRQPQRRR